MSSAGARPPHCAPPLPLRLALPHLEPVLLLNVDKEVEKDTLVILRAGELVAESPADWNDVLPQLLQASKEIDRTFLARVGRFPVDIVVRYEEIAPIRSTAHEAALRCRAENPEGEATARTRCASPAGRILAGRIRTSAVRVVPPVCRRNTLPESLGALPGPLALLREMIAQELLNVMLRVARPLANEIASLSFRPPASTGPETPNDAARPAPYRQP